MKKPRKASARQGPAPKRKRGGRSFADAANIALSPQDIERILDGWVIERHDIESEAWKAIAQREKNKMLGKLTKFRLRGLLPWLPRLSAYRDKNFIVQQYSKTWTEQPWPSLNEPLTAKLRTPTTWRREGMVIRRGGIKRLSLEVLARFIEQAKPRSVLEVGSGSGRNLFVLSTRFPGVSFTGIELTQAGVDKARETAALPSLPREVKDYAPWGDADEKAYKRIVFTQGSATDMPFKDGEFDLVFSHAALEQMENVREAALRECRRVAKSAIVMIEPFGNFNDDDMRPLAIRAKNYLTLRLEELPAFGMEPVFSWADWPRKIAAGYGVVVARKGGTA